MKFLVAAAMAGACAIPGGTQGTPGVANIVNSGSTNTVPWSLRVQSDGRTWVMQNGRARFARLQAAPIAQFFRDLAAARGVAGAQTCMKSVSFGSRTSVQWRGWSSPDLSCPQQDPRLAALARDVSAIEEFAGIIPSRRIPVPVEPRRVPNGAQ